MKETLLSEQTQELVALGCQPISTLTEMLRSLPLSFPVAPGGFATLSMEWDGNYGEEWETGYADLATHSEELIDALFELIKLLIQSNRRND